MNLPKNERPLAVNREEPRQAMGQLYESTPMRLPHLSPAALAGLRILIVDDNPVNRLIALRMVERMGHDCAIACNGREALKAVSSRPFDLVLMDIQMPEMDGLEATRRIRESERGYGGHLPIIALTANCLPGDRERCLDGGMDGYVPKPVQGRQLEETIGDVLSAAGARCA